MLVTRWSKGSAVLAAGVLIASAAVLPSSAQMRSRWGWGGGGRRGFPAEFSFVGPQDTAAGRVVKGAPFQAEVVSQTVQELPDGNRISRQFTGLLARDSEGRTRREMVLEHIGPLAASGQPPRLVFITDPVAQKSYALDQGRKIAWELPYREHREMLTEPNQQSPRRGQRRPGGALAQATVQTESLGQKMIEGVLAEGTRLTRTIPAGAVGNEKPIVITTERWYSPQLQTVVLQIRSDPRFGTSTYQLTHISLGEPPAELFTVPSDYRWERGRRRMGRLRQPGGEPG